jgi:hypothetical protein
MVRKIEHEILPGPAEDGLTDAAAIELALELHQAERGNPQTSELELLAFLIRANDGDPEAELCRVLRNQTKHGAKMGSRVAALLEVKRERQRAGKKALAVAVSLVFSIWRICNDVRKIREHLDRVVPDYIRQIKARLREKAAGTEEAGGS